MEAIGGFVIIFVIILIIILVLILITRLFGAWMLRINELIKLQQATLDEIKKTNQKLNQVDD